MIRFITLHQYSGTTCHINVAEIRAIFPDSKQGTSINIGTMGNIPVTESPTVVLSRIADALID